MAGMSPNGPGPVPAELLNGSLSPRAIAAAPEPPVKSVQFVLTAPYRSRLPLRLEIRHTDTTDGITSTVRNFFGLYPGPDVTLGISFEDDDGSTFIARYDNVHEDKTVFVRVTQQPLGLAFHAATSPAPVYHNANANGYLPGGPQPPHAHASRPTSGASRLRSPSPNGGRGRRSTSTGTNPTAGKKGRSRSSKNRSQVNGDAPGDSFNGYSSGDGAAGSSFRSKEQLGNTDISVENIVEGGRRKRAKFESAELPLFAPPQMPASTSNPSVSPARRFHPHQSPLPFIQSGQNPFSNPQPLPSPGSYMNGYTHTNMYGTPGSDNGRDRRSFGLPGQGVGSVMMTPDPTVRSAVSEEDKDVAMQLMWMSARGRASASTQDDTFSGRADAASSTGATSDAESGSEDDAPAPRRQKMDDFSHHNRVFNTTGSHFISPQNSTETGGEDDDSSDDAENRAMAAPKGSKPKANTLVKPRPQSSHKTKSSSKAIKPTAKKPASIAGPMTPASLPASRKQSIVSTTGFSLGPGEDEQPDLSTKPRCQRCRKSKKGCDRQRPCGRCRDAGLPAEMCISEDEGNGRKGRYGRHMGVPVKNDGMPPPATNLLPAAPIAVDGFASTMSAPIALDKNKKRKR